MKYLEHIDTKRLFVVDLKFKLTCHLVFSLAKSGNSIWRDNKTDASADHHFK